jgi:hypothetical protein
MADKASSSASVAAPGFATKYVLSCCAATLAESGVCVRARPFGVHPIVTYPLDLTKTLLQVQGEHTTRTSSAAPRHGMLRIAVDIGTV